MQPDTRQITDKTVLNTVGANAQPLLDTEIYVVDRVVDTTREPLLVS